MKFIYEKNEINLERWKQSDIIHTIPNNICQLADMTFNQINYAMDFTFVSGIFFIFSLSSMFVFCTSGAVVFFSLYLIYLNQQMHVRTNNFIFFISGYQVM